MTRAKVYASVWDALADTPEQAALPGQGSNLGPAD
jgi:predicted XRE-type DNA-binding protein